MKIAWNWLRDYLPVEIDLQEAFDLLTDAGLEVEGTEHFESIQGGLAGLVVGEVLACEKHPDADRLKVTTVDLGAETVQIVCGAPNVAAGQKVPVATVGTTLYPTGEESFKIKKSKIRGVESIGMICAEDEIGTGTSHDGIMVLPNELKAGTPLAEYLNVATDTVIEIGLTPNRTDGMGHYGVARDLKAILLAQKGSSPALVNPENEIKAPTNQPPVTVKIEDTTACPRYSGITIKNVKVEASPKWLQNRLLSIGLRPINNVVDITNFVMREMGQPLHAFDVEAIKDNQVVVKTAIAGTKFTTLDGVERELHQDDLMICNATEGMCIAGVFGGETSGVKESTTDIFLESAYFQPVSIRKTAKRHGLNTDASFRYERGIDPSGTIEVLKRAAKLICDIAVGELHGSIVDEYPSEIKPIELDFRPAFCNRIIGKQLPNQVIEDILHSLDFAVESADTAVWKLTVPMYRVDVTREIDVVEEVLRVYGYNNVEIPEQPHTAAVLPRNPEPFDLRNKIINHLVGNGFLEIKNNSLTAKSDKLKGQVEINNPLNVDLDVMRVEIQSSLLKTIAHNLNYRNADLKIFELGKVYQKQEDKYTESEMLAIAVTGKASPEAWNLSSDNTDFYQLKETISRLLENLGLPKFSFKIAEDHLEVISRNQPIGIVKTVDSTTLKSKGVSQAVYFAELDFNALLTHTANRKFKFEALPKYPSVRRDLALLVDNSISYDELQAIAKKNGKKLLKTVNLFDVYEGKNLPDGKKSYALSFVFQDANRTLQDKDIDKVMERLVNQYKNDVGAELR